MKLRDLHDTLRDAIAALPAMSPMDRINAALKAMDALVKLNGRMVDALENHDRRLERADERSEDLRARSLAVLEKIEAKLLPL